MNETSSVKVSLVTLSFQRKVVNKIKSVLGILVISVLLVAVVLTVTAGIADAEPTAIRILPEELVPATKNFPVKIEVSNCSLPGQVVETFSAEFVYLTSTLNVSQVRVYGPGVYGPTNTVKFTLYNETSFDYTVALRYYDIEEGTYPFNGKFKDFAGEYTVGGDTEIEVVEAEEEAEPIATRTLPEEPISAGESFTIGIEASYYDISNHVVETLPEGFIFEDYSGLKPGSVEVEDNTVEFSLEGEPSFTYTVIAPDTEGTYTFSGILMNEYKIGGDTEIVVGEKSGEILLPANITAWNPIGAFVNNTEGESRTFNITTNQTADISWQINGTEVQTNESIAEAAYTNASAVVGIWNVSAIATNTTIGVSDMHTWTWSVTLTPTITPTPAVNITSTPTPTPSVTPTPTSKPSITPTPVSTPTPSPPGFETGLAFAAIFAVAYLLLFRKKKR